MMSIALQQRKTIHKDETSFIVSEYRYAYYDHIS
jgi:hypothetical protein